MKNTDCEVSCMKDEHLEYVMEIEQRNRLFYDENIEMDILPITTWTREDFERAMGKSKMRCYVVTEGTVITGFIVIELSKKTVEILNIGVHLAFRRSGFATALLGYTHDNVMSQSAGKSITCYSEETNESLFRFLSKHGFKSRLDRNYFEGSDGTRRDGIHWTWGKANTYEVTG